MTVLEFVQHAQQSDIKPTDRLDSLGLDSLEFVELLQLIEGEFSVLIPDVEISRLRTVEDLINLVDRLQNSSIVRS